VEAGSADREAGVFPHDLHVPAVVATAVPRQAVERVHGGPRPGGLPPGLDPALQHDRPATGIAELLGCDPRTVRRWVHRNNQEGANGLADRPSVVRRPRVVAKAPPTPSLYQVTRKAVSATFIPFMAYVMAGYPDAPLVVLVLDNVIIHRSKQVQGWPRLHPRTRLVYGEPYSPHHNPVKWIWGALKAALANSPTLTIAGRIRQVHAFFRHRTLRSCWRPPRRTAHHGFPRVTDRTTGQPLRTSSGARSASRSLSKAAPRVARLVAHKSRPLVRVAGGRTLFGTAGQSGSR
jgi:transposase